MEGGIMADFEALEGNKCCAKYSWSVSFGLFLIRVGIGLAFVLVYGYAKITGGPEAWEGIGKAMGTLGITFMPVFWGFMAAFAEFVGGILLILGLFFRPAAFLMFFTMLVATIMKMGGDGGYLSYSHPIELCILFFGLIFTGAGKISLGYAIPALRNRCWR